MGSFPASHCPAGLLRQPGMLLPGLGPPQRVAGAIVNRAKCVMVALWGSTASGNRGTTPGRQLGRQRLLTSPSSNWLVVKPSYERRGSWCAGAHETRGVMPLKTKDTEFMGSRCFQLELSSGGSLVPWAELSHLSQPGLAKTPKSPRTELPWGPLTWWIWEENAGALVLPALCFSRHVPRTCVGCPTVWTLHPGTSGCLCWARGFSALLGGTNASLQLLPGVPWVSLRGSGWAGNALRPSEWLWLSWECRGSVRGALAELPCFSWVLVVCRRNWG